MRPRVGFYVAIFVGLLLILLGLGFAYWVISRGYVTSSDAIMFILGTVFGATLGAGSVILQGKLTAGKEIVRCEAPEGYTMEADVKIREK